MITLNHNKKLGSSIKQISKGEPSNSPKRQDAIESFNKAFQVFLDMEKYHFNKNMTWKI